MAKKRDADWKLFDKRYDDAVQAGTDNATAFLKTVREPGLQKSAAVKRYQDEFKADPVLVHQQMVKKAVKDANVAPFDMVNTAYEGSFFDGLNIASADDEANTANFKTFMKKKWLANGYVNDSLAVKVYKKGNLPLKGWMRPVKE